MRHRASTWCECSICGDFGLRICRRKSQAFRTRRIWAFSIASQDHLIYVRGSRKAAGTPSHGPPVCCQNEMNNSCPFKERNLTIFSTFWSLCVIMTLRYLLKARNEFNGRGFYVNNVSGVTGVGNGNYVQSLSKLLHNSKTVCPKTYSQASQESVAP